MTLHVLLDACVPHWIRRKLICVEVHTAQFAGLDHLSNGTLLDANDGRYDVLVTLDRNLTFQQKLENRRLSVVVLQPLGQDRASYELLLEEIALAIRTVMPGTVIVVGLGIKASRKI